MLKRGTPLVRVEQKRTGFSGTTSLVHNNLNLLYIGRFLEPSLPDDGLFPHLVTQANLRNNFKLATCSNYGDNSFV